jgi:hypothetical protein
VLDLLGVLIVKLGDQLWQKLLKQVGALGSYCLLIA